MLADISIKVLFRMLFPHLQCRYVFCRELAWSSYIMQKPSLLVVRKVEFVDKKEYVVTILDGPKW